MGMFDYIVCRYPLPGKAPSFIKKGHMFQTKDLECLLETYIISSNGRLSHSDFSGKINFYTSNIAGAGAGIYTSTGENAESVDYEAIFKDGYLISITETERTCVPALPASNMFSALDRKKPTEEELQKAKDRDNELLAGKKVYVLWGGQEEGYVAEVVADGKRKICIKKLSGDMIDGDLELLHRSDRDRIFFDTEAEAKADKNSRKEKWEKEKKEYEDHVAANPVLKTTNKKRKR